MDWTLKPSASTAGGKTPATGKRKMAIVNEDEAADEEDAAAAPAKRAKVVPKPRKKASATPKKGKAAAGTVSPVAAKDESDEDKVGSEDKAGVKEEEVDGEV